MAQLADDDIKSLDWRDFGLLSQRKCRLETQDLMKKIQVLESQNTQLGQQLSSVAAKHLNEQQKSSKLEAENSSLKKELELAKLEIAKLRSARDSHRDSRVGQGTDFATLSPSKATNKLRQGTLSPLKTSSNKTVLASPSLIGTGGTSLTNSIEYLRTSSHSSPVKSSPMPLHVSNDQASKSALASPDPDSDYVPGSPIVSVGRQLQLARTASSQAKSNARFLPQISTCDAETVNYTPTHSDNANAEFVSVAETPNLFPSPAIAPKPTEKCDQKEDILEAVGYEDEISDVAFLEDDGSFCVSPEPVVAKPPRLSDRSNRPSLDDSTIPSSASMLSDTFAKRAAKNSSNETPPSSSMHSNKPNKRPSSWESDFNQKTMTKPLKEYARKSRLVQRSINDFTLSSSPGLKQVVTVSKSDPFIKPFGKSRSPPKAPSSDRKKVVQAKQPTHSLSGQGTSSGFGFRNDRNEVSSKRPKPTVPKVRVPAFAATNDNDASDFLCSYDRVPPKEPAFPYKTKEVVRKKAERCHLHGYAKTGCCDAAFQDLAEGLGDPTIVQKVSRHRTAHVAPSTPKDYWDLAFPYATPK